MFVVTRTSTCATLRAWWSNGLVKRAAHSIVGVAGRSPRHIASPTPLRRATCAADVRCLRAWSSIRRTTSDNDGGVVRMVAGSSAAVRPFDSRRTWSSTAARDDTVAGATRDIDSWGRESRFASTLPEAAWVRIRRDASRCVELHRLLATEGLSSEQSKEYGQEMALLQAIVAPSTQLAQRIKEIGETYDMLGALPRNAAGELVDGEAKELEALYLEEIEQGTKAAHSLEATIIEQLLPPEPIAERNAIVEVRAGTGGLEASLFAQELFEMYQQWASSSGFRCEVLSVGETDVGGIRDASALVSGNGAYGLLRHESGVHRVQRIPETETLGRVHTSTVTVAVLPEAAPVDVELDEKDLRVDVYRSSGAGGQHVNTTESAVRITHIPTGLSVAIQDERSQHKNRAKAMKVLLARLYEQKLEEQQAKVSQQRNSLIGSGKRSERIRTYNFPQSRITDHRVGLNKFNIDAMMQGELLDDFIQALAQLDRREKLEFALREQADLLAGDNAKKATGSKQRNATR